MGITSDMVYDMEYGCTIQCRMLVLNSDMVYDCSIQYGIFGITGDIDCRWLFANIAVAMTLSSLATKAVVTPSGICQINGKRSSDWKTFKSL